MRGWAGTAAAAYISARSGSCLGGCKVSSAVLPLPSGQSVLTAPSNESVHFIGVAFGIQNYTCSSSNNYTNVGAVAELFDVSCLYDVDPGLLATIQEPLFAAWSNFTSDFTIQEAIQFLPRIVPAELILAQHYFIPNSAGGLSPTWDFRATKRFKGVRNALFVGKGIASLPDPINPAVNVAWLDVGHVSGDIAAQVFRTNTVGGQPPSSCTFGSSPNITVKYSSQYWFLGGSLNRHYSPWRGF